MVLGDSSAWVDFLRGRRTRASARLTSLLDSAELVTTSPVVLEVLAGARDEAHARTLRRMLESHAVVRTQHDDHVAGAAIYRTCRRRGATPRSLADCVIAAIAIRIDAAVLHSDRDFDLIARHVPLTLDR